MPGGVSQDNDMARRNKAGQHSCALVRRLGIDIRQPTHGWRHRFKTVARRVDMPSEWSDAVTGHEDGRPSCDYGEFELAKMAEWIDKMPWYDLTDPER
jgi:hypothetical protein